MAVREQETYLENLQSLVTARTEQLRVVAIRLQEITAELDKLRQQLQARGCSEEASAVEQLIRKMREL